MKMPMTEKDNINVTVTIKNQSDVPGYEIIQLYIRDHVARISRPLKELKAFKKVWFEAGQTKEIVLNINIEHLTYRTQQNEKVFDKGKFTVMVGSSSINYLEKTFTLV